MRLVYPRERYEGGDKFGTFEMVRTGDNPGTFNYYVGYFKEWNVIKDDLPHRFIRGTHRYPNGPCYHLHIVNPCQYLKPFHGYGGTNSPSMMPVSLRVQRIIDLMPVFPDSLRSQLNEEAFTDFSTQFPEEISFSEFILGLRQIVDLLPRIESSFTRTAAGGYLNKKFGWDNLISDLKALSSICKTVQSRIEWLKKTRGKPVKLGFLRNNCYTPILANSVYYEEPPYYGVRLGPKGYRADYRAGAQLLQYIDYLDDSIGFIRAFIGALGLNNPLKVVWVNMPLSFVFDWFFQISKHLTRLAAVKPAEQWDVMNVTNTLKVRFQVDVWQDNPYAGEKFLLGTVSYDSYDREVGLPVPLDVYNPVGLTPSELTLLIAMVFTHR